MKHLFFYSLILFFVNTNAQQNLSFGKIKADSNFCSSGRERSLQSIFKPIDSAFTTICNSNNELEIRLLAVSLPHVSMQLIILTFNNGNWGIKKYSSKDAALGNELSYTTIKIGEDRKPVSNYYLNSVFETLKNNNIFLLPFKEELDDKYIQHDGAAFTLTFKAGNSFRSYSFNGSIAASFKQYDTILHTMEGLIE
jgi:hypothetical protein